MSLRFLGSVLLTVTLALAGGCHNSNQSRYGAAYGQPAVVAANPGCNSCGTPVPPGTIPPPPQPVIGR